ncbi:MAG: peptide chain release factor N(5)-glutamine methyltransferase [Acholeplasmataceae bacterium]|jgi:release factor glutamine methyltransferase
MILRDLLRLGYEKIEEFNKERTAAKLLLSGLLEMSVGDIVINFDKEITDETAEEYLELLDFYVLEDVPIQYLVGSTNFYGRRFIVDERVLIPRPETEYLVDKVIKKLPNDLKVLEIGTGSGIIAVTLNLEKNYQIDATDIDSSALQVAVANSKINGADVNFIYSDLYENITEKYDLIISNPPYVSETDEVAPSVLFEPEIALYSDNLGTMHLSLIILGAAKHLKEDGIIILEHGYKHGLYIKFFVNNYLSDYRSFTLKDLQGKQRYSIIRKRGSKWKRDK